MGPGGKTVLPGRAEAKLDLRLVPDMTKDEAVAKLKAHLAKRGFGDIEVIVSGGYGPTQTDENSPLIQARASDTRPAAKIPMTMSARSAGSWPGVMFTGAAAAAWPAGQFGARAWRRRARPRRVATDRKQQPEDRRLRRAVDVVMPISFTPSRDEAAKK